MSNYYLLDAAAQDLVEIYVYTMEMYTYEQWRKYCQSVHCECQKIAKHPFLFGKSLLKSNKNMRIVNPSCLKHYIIYEVQTDNSIEILRLYHVQRDLEKIKCKHSKQ